MEQYFELVTKWLQMAICVENTDLIRYRLYMDMAYTGRFGAGEQDETMAYCLVNEMTVAEQMLTN